MRERLAQLIGSTRAGERDGALRGEPQRRERRVGVVREDRVPARRRAAEIARLELRVTQSVRDRVADGRDEVEVEHLLEPGQLVRWRGRFTRFQLRRLVELRERLLRLGVV